VSYRESLQCTGADCSARGCTEKIDFPKGAEMNFFHAREAVTELAKAAGWSCWIGRSAWLYCAQHGPAATTVARGRTTRHW
jgi:hypothetical protein